MPLFRRKSPKSFEGSALASCRRLRPDAEWNLDRAEDRITGDGITVNLSNLRLIWQAKDPDERPRWLEGHLSEVLYRVGQVDPGRPADDDIRTMIRPRVMLESSRLQALTENRPLTDVPPFRQLTDDLVTVLGVDSPTSIALVSGESIRKWDSTFDDLWNVGVASVNQLPDGDRFIQVEQSVYVSEVQDDYTNSRLVNPGYLNQLSINGPAVVLLPHRNALIVAPLIDDDAVTFACNLALQQLNQPSQICAKPFVLSEGDWRPLIVGQDHPGYRSVSLLRLIDDDVNHKQVHQALIDLVGDELVIAGFYVDQDRLVSSTNWGPRAALLPATDEVVFIDDEEGPSHGMVAPWDAVTELFGDRMVATDYYPKRYRVEGLPDPEAIRSIAQPLSSLSPF